MVLEAISKKIEQLYEQVIFHEKFIEEYDGVSLSSFTLSDEDLRNTKDLLHLPHVTEGNIPILLGWEKLQKEINDILDEGSLLTQQIYHDIDHDISSQIQDRYRIAYSNMLSTTITTMIKVSEETVTPSSSSAPSSSLPPKLTGIIRGESTDEIEEEITEVKTVQRRNETEIMQLSILHKELRYNLRQIHEFLSELLEEKLIILQRINKIIHHYRIRITRIGTVRGVRNAGKKLEFILHQKIQNLLSHQFFIILEEESRQQLLQSYWSSLYLGSDKFVPLAGKALAKSLYHREASFLDWTTHIKIGGIIMLLLWSFSESLNNESYLTIWNDPTFAVFVCFGDLLLLLLMWAVSMHVWKSSGIDFIQLLQLQHTEIGQSKYPVSLVIKSFIDDVLIFLLTFILFNKIIRGAHRGQYRLAIAHVIPVLLTIYYCYRVTFPFSKSRKAWLYMLWKVIAAPFYPVDFGAGYIGDLLTSLVRVSVPFLFSILYVILSLIAWITNNLDWAVTTSNTWWSEYKIFHLGFIPLLMLYPLWIRFVQCLRRSIETKKRWPHYANALKYTSALLVIAYGSFQPQLRQNSLWIFAFVCATIYQFIWDIFQDWGIIVIGGVPSSAGPSESPSITDILKNLEKVTFSFRRKRLLGSIWVYILVMIFNLAFRFAWTLTLLPPVDPKEHGFSLYSVVMYHIGTLIAALEIVRRMVWGFFRLEYEQIELMKKKNLESLLKEGINMEENKNVIGESEVIKVDESDEDYANSAISRKKTDFDDSVFDKMEIGNSGGHQHLRGFYSSYSFSSLFVLPTDWTSFLPVEVLRWIEAIPLVEDKEQKYILVETLFFSGVVAISILQLAWAALV